MRNWQIIKKQNQLPAVPIDFEVNVRDFVDFVFIEYETALIKNLISFDK